MKTFSKKRKLKGMTLIEIIIAIAVVAVMSSVLVVAASSVNSYLKSARDINYRVSEQAPAAEAGNTNKAVRVTNGSGALQEAEITIKSKSSGSGSFTGEIVLSADMYQSFDSDEMTAINEKTKFGEDLNMRFLDNIEAPTGEEPTEAAT